MQCRSSLLIKTSQSKTLDKKLKAKIVRVKANKIGASITLAVCLVSKRFEYHFMVAIEFVALLFRR